ncbi:MAG: DUF302 domain-containing protein [Candidatus Acidiferrales bacterium]
MATREIMVKRFTLTSKKPFAEVLAAIDLQIGHPDMRGFGAALTGARTIDEARDVVNGATSSIGLMEFARFDLGMVLRKEMGESAPRVVRIVAGNPMIMKEMVKHVHDAGSYAPVTILVDERDGGVMVSYDRMESCIATYGSDEALAVARDLDAKLERVIEGAVG